MRGRQSAAHESGDRRDSRIRPRRRRTCANAAHRRVGAVVGDRLDDRQPRAAMRAVGERIAVAAGAGSKISSRQAAQVAASGATPVRISSPRLAMMLKVTAARHDVRRGSARSHRSAPAAAASARSSATKPAMSGGRAADGHDDALAVIRRPSRPGHGRRARRQTVGRKPTPCTRPRTRISSAQSVTVVPMHSPADRGRLWLPEG